MAQSTLFKTALNKSMALCSRKEYAVSEIITKLELWGISAAENEKIIDLLISENFINEDRFARAFVKDKFNYNKWGKVKISVHLKAKKIPGNIVKAALDTIDNETYIKVLNDLIANHRKTVKAKNQYDLKAKLIRFALSKGFESSLVYDAMNESEE